METTENNTRVRINFSLTAKGKVQWEITSEFPTLEESEKNMRDAIDSIRKIIEEKGLSEAGQE